MRTVFSVGVLLLWASLTFAGEVLVFTDGSRMEVQHYEIRGNIVVITTLDGKLLSVPISYLLLSQRPASPSEIDLTLPTPPQPYDAPDAVAEGFEVSDQIAKARQALALYGAERLVLRLQWQVEEELVAVESQLTPAEHQMLSTTARRRFETQRLLDVVAMALAEAAQDLLLDSWIDWFQSPLAQRVLVPESSSTSPPDLSTSPRRLELMRRLDKALGASETGLEMRLATKIAFQEILPKHVQKNADVETLRVQWSDPVREATEKDLLSSYRGACNDDLWGYLTYWESLPGRRFAELMRAALLSGVQSAGGPPRRAQSE